MTNKLQSNGYTFTCIGVTDDEYGHDRYWLVEDDEGNDISEAKLEDAFMELFYQPSSGAGSQYCTYYRLFIDPERRDTCVATIEWRYDV